MTTDTRPEGAPYLPAVIDDRPAFLTRDTPLIDTIPDRWIEYIAKTVAIAEDPNQHPITKGEIGMLVEVAARYALDPFAKEIWLAKSKRGKLLMMVARDGLRKIAQRNGLHVDGDVVHEGDTFSVTRTPDGNRVVSHAYTITKDRGKILGAWAEVREGGPVGRPMGFFWAALSEYKPAGASEWSVWGKQVSVMILGAAERTAIRQATPLGGLVAFGEHESAFAKETIGDGDGDGQPVGLDLGPDVEKVIARAAVLGHAALSDRATIEMQLGAQSPEKVAGWVQDANRELDDVPTDADVVQDASEAVSGVLSGSGAPATESKDATASGPQQRAQPHETGKYAAPTPQEQQAADELGVAVVSQGFLDDGPPRRAEPQRDPEAVERMRAHAMELLDFADAMDADGKADDAERAREKAEGLMAQVDAASDPPQETLPL